MRLVCSIALALAFVITWCAAVHAQSAGGEAMPSSPGHHWLHFPTTLNGRASKLAYIVYLPKGYDTAPADKSWPLILFLHGNGDQGTDLSNAFKWGPGHELEKPGNSKFHDSFPFIVLYPQCPPRGQRWDQPEMERIVLNLLEATTRRLRVDRNRVYVTGLSMGGTGSWHVALAGPERFAAVGEFAGVAVRPQEAAQKLKYVPCWGVTGLDDGWPTEGNRQMAAAIRGAGGRMKLTAVPHGGHSVQQPFYASPQWYEWLLAQRRLSPQEQKAYDAQKQPPPFPQSPGHYELEFEKKDGQQQVLQLSYSLSLPKDYRPDAAPLPLLVFLHDALLFGMEVDGRYLHGPQLALASSQDAATLCPQPLIVVSPRCQPTFQWGQPQMNKAVIALVDELSAKLRIDKTRIYISGLNAGAIGAWACASEAPARFAALGAVLTEDGIDPPASTAVGLGNLPMLVVGSAQATSRVESALKGKVSGLTLRPRPTLPTVQAPAQGYDDPRFYAWLLSHRRDAAVAKK